MAFAALSWGCASPTIRRVDRTGFDSVPREAGERPGPPMRLASLRPTVVGPNYLGPGDLVRINVFNPSDPTAGQKYELFEAFLGMVAGRTETEIEEFLKSATILVNEVKKGKYDPGFMVNTILNELSGGILDQLTCLYCGAEFVMLKRRQKAIHGGQLPGKVPMQCPDCGEVVKVVVKTPLSVTLKKVIVSKKPVLKKPEETTPEEKEQGENQDG